MAWDIVIAGGGFGGYYAARTLERRLPHHAARVTLVNDVNFMLYTPLLPGAAAGTLEPRHVVVPLREQLRRTDLWLGHVVGAEPSRNCLVVDSVDGRRHHLHYDQLIVALGSISRTLPIPGLAEHAVGFKTLSEAIALRNRVITMLEIAETIHDAEQRAEYLTFMFVGAGYAGLEGIAELQDFVTDVIDLYPRCRVQGVRFVLVEARDRVMPEVAPRLAAFAERELRGRGMEIRTNTTVEAVTDRTVTLKGGEVIPCRTFAWTAGVKPSPVVARLGLPLHGRSGRIEVDQTMRVAGHRNVWAIGDAAAVADPARKGSCRRRRRSTRSARADGSPATSPPSSAPPAACGRSPTRRRASSSTWAATRRSRARWASDCAASRRGSWPARTTLRTCPAGTASRACWSTGRSRCCSRATPPSWARSATRRSSSTSAAARAPAARPTASAPRPRRPRRQPRLAVEPGDLSNAVEWWPVAERAVGASLVVVTHPVWQ